MIEVNGFKVNLHIHVAIIESSEMSVVSQIDQIGSGVAKGS